jgi:hypothetical protein
MSESPVSASDLSAALTDVRRAYRLLHEYHLRLSGLFAKFDELARAEGYTFHSSGPAFFKRLRNKGSKPFWEGRWAWDVLPGYALGADYRREDSFGDEVSTSCIVFQIVADSGYTKEGATGEPRGWRFEPAESARTEVRVGRWWSEGREFDARGAWAGVEGLYSDTRNPWDGQVHRFPVGDTPHAYRYVSLDLVELAAPETFDAWARGVLGEWPP